MKISTWKAAPYVALDLNLNDQSVANNLISMMSEHLVNGKVEKFAWRKKMANNYINYSNIAIMVIILLLVPMFVRVRKVIKMTYSVLQQLYNFELKF